MSLFSVQKKLDKIIAVTSDNLQSVIRRCEGLNDLDQTTAESAYDSNRLNLSVNQLYQSTQQRQSLLFSVFDTVSSSVWMVFSMVRSVVSNDKSISQTVDQRLNLLSNQSISCQVMDPKYVQVNDNTLNDRPFMDVAMRLLLSPADREKSTVEFNNLSNKQSSNQSDHPTISVKISFCVEFDDDTLIDNYRSINQSIKPIARARFVQFVRNTLCKEDSSKQHLATITFLSMNEPLNPSINPSNNQSINQSTDRQDDPSVLSCIQVPSPHKQPIKQTVRLSFEIPVTAKTSPDNIPYAYQLALQCLQSINQLTNQSKAPFCMNNELRVPPQPDTLIVNVLHRELQFALVALKRASQQSVNQSITQSIDPPVALPVLPNRPAIKIDSPQLANWFDYETHVSDFIECTWNRLIDRSINLQSDENAYHSQYIQSLFSSNMTTLHALTDLEMQLDHVKDQTRCLIDRQANKVRHDADSLQSNWKQFNSSYAVLHDRLKQRWVKLLAHNCGIITIPPLPEETEIKHSNEDPVRVKLRGKELFNQETALLEMVMNDCIAQYNMSRTAVKQIDPSRSDDDDENFPQVYLKAIADLKTKLEEEQSLYAPGVPGQSLEQALRRNHFQSK